MQRLHTVSAHLVQAGYVSGDVDAVAWAGTHGTVLLRPRPGGLTPNDIIVVTDQLARRPRTSSAHSDLETFLLGTTVRSMHG